MERLITLRPDDLRFIRSIDSRLVSYNIEMTEVTGGTFWKAYTPGQIAGTEDFPLPEKFSDFTAMEELLQYYPPIDLYNEHLRVLAKELGPAWVRVSGTWATKTYYDFADATNGKVPEGYQSVLTKEQWIGVLDFVRAVGAKLLISVSNCAGDHPNGGALDLTQTQKIFDFSHSYGVDIDAVEFMNEPNMLEVSGAPKGYTPADYVRDHDIFNRWVRSHYPQCLVVGPCNAGGIHTENSDEPMGGGIESMMETCTVHDLLRGAKEKLDVFSYHYYNGISERLASLTPFGHWDAKFAHTDRYLGMASVNARNCTVLRDHYVPDGQIWVTESGDAGGGGNTWASTYLDVLRTLNELGSFTTITDGVIFHNTLASSDYGFLNHDTFDPRPNYFAVFLWNKLMGNVVYDCGIPVMENAHIYAHSRKDGKAGAAYLIINNSLEKALTVEIQKEADCYTLSGKTMRSSIMLLNSMELSVGADGNMPLLFPVRQAAGKFELAPGTCTFLIM